MAIIIFRTLIIYISLLLAMRLMGKRQLGELELSELIVTVLVSDIAAHPLQDIGIPLLNGLLPIIILLCCELIISGVLVKSVKARVLLSGKPSILISDGVIDQKEMKKNRFTLNELTEELRNQSLLDISKIKFAILETSGKLNVIPFPAEKPVTAGQMGISVDDTGYPLALIMNGRVLSDNLKKCKKNEEWLQKELKSRSVKAHDEVYYMSLNSAGQIYFLKAEKEKNEKGNHCRFW